MASVNGIRRQLTKFVAIMSAALFAVALAAAPAQATYGSPLPVDLQLTSSSGTIQVGRIVGTLQFDNGNSHYWVSATICRQSSYTNPNVRVFVNGSLHQYLTGTYGSRPQICGGHGISEAVNSGFAYAGTIYNITISIEGIHFDGSTATTRTRSTTYDNPFN